MQLLPQIRALAHRAIRLRDPAPLKPPTSFLARRWFLRGLALVYLIAFASLWVQVDGLIGEKGVLPAGDFLHAVHEQFGARGYFLCPTLCWFGSDSGALHLLCASGVLVSLLLIVGITPVPCLAWLWLAYVSLTIAGQTFLSFQWDCLLLETGFLAIFFAPWELWPRRAREAPLSRTALCLLRLLLFKLMFMSGVVKLTSGDDSWTKLTALAYHYQTQPLPTPLGWWAHQMPEWFQHFSVATMLAIELVGSFLILAPGRWRVAGFAVQVFLQICIALTGNYGFFNLLTLVLCLLLVDNSHWPRRLRPRCTPELRGFRCPALLMAPLAAAWLLFSGFLLANAFVPTFDFPSSIAWLYDWIEPFRSLNGYGLFRVMTRTRPEIIIEGSNDGEHWVPYEFRWKPGDLTRAPRFVAPYQPRLDWQMWFAALGSYQNNPWFVQLLFRLLQGSPPVLALLEKNPFPDAPPRYLRAVLYEYRFSTPSIRRKTGEWWEREEKGLYCPVVSLSGAAQ